MVTSSPMKINRRLTVLIVDDSADTLAMMELILSELKYNVLTACDAETALSIAVEQLPDIILSDIGMPGMDGYEFIRQLRATTGTQNIPAIALTGYVIAEEKKRAIANGFNYCISKPVNFPLLFNLLEEIAEVLD